MGWLYEKHAMPLLAIRASFVLDGVPVLINPVVDGMRFGADELVNVCNLPAQVVLAGVVNLYVVVLWMPATVREFLVLLQMVDVFGRELVVWAILNDVPVLIEVHKVTNRGPWRMHDVVALTAHIVGDEIPEILHSVGVGNISEHQAVVLNDAPKSVVNVSPLPSVQAAP